MPQYLKPLPHADGPTGLKVMRALAQQASPLTALDIMHANVGQVFQITLPGFSPGVFVGSTANRQLLVSDRHQFHWRSETDPVTRLLRHGLLVEDGDMHALLRSRMEPVLQRHQVTDHVDAIWHYTDHMVAAWSDNATPDILIEMRRLALIILFSTLFKVDFGPDIERLWQPILRILKYISPGLWILWPDIPRFGFKSAIKEMDDYLYQIIRNRRSNMGQPDDLLGCLVHTPNMSDDLIRDQLLTMLIAGHDTSTALLTWTLYLLGHHPESMARVQVEIDKVLPSRKPPTAQQINRLYYLDQVIKEALRLYPPIHVGNRMAVSDTQLNGYHIPMGTRVMYSIYLSHRDSRYWQNPNQFQPDRFDRQSPERCPAFTYLPFGGGPRNCIGAAFAQLEAKVVLARILQTVNLKLVSPHIQPYMGATLEPHPSVAMHVQRRI